MSDPIENCTLEVSCTVGSLDNALDAIESGADINCRSGAPLFNAIYNRNLEIIRMLIEKGADLSFFLPTAKLKPIEHDTDQIVEALMACAPPDPDAIELDPMEEFDEELRAKGLEAPVKSGDWDGLVRYANKLEKIGAEKALACVNELIELLKPAKEFGDAALFESVKAEKKAIAAISERYRDEAEDIGNFTQLYISTQDSGFSPAPPATEEPSEASEEPSPFAPPPESAASGESEATPDAAESDDSRPITPQTASA